MKKTGSVRVYGELIRRIRVENGWSLSDLGERAEIGTRTLQKLEKGGNGKPSTIKAISDALNIRMQDLLADYQPVTQPQIQTSLNLSVNIKPEDAASPDDFKYLCRLLQETMQKFENYKEVKRKYGELPSVDVWFVPGTDEEDRKTYMYAVVSSSLRKEMYNAIAIQRRVPDFAVVVQTGYGEPTVQVKAYMKMYYDYDDDRAEDDVGKDD